MEHVFLFLALALVEPRFQTCHSHDRLHQIGFLLDGSDELDVVHTRAIGCDWLHRQVHALTVMKMSFHTHRR